MSKEAYRLQGLNGWVALDGTAGFTQFVGRSAGVQIVASTDIALIEGLECLNGTALVTTVAPQFIGGVITTLVVTSGLVLVYPMDGDYILI